MWHRHATLIISIAYFSAGKIQSHTINVIRKNSTSSKFFFSTSLPLLKTFAIKWHSPQVEFIFLRKCRFHKFIMRFIRFNSQLFSFLLLLLLFFCFLLNEPQLDYEISFIVWKNAALWRKRKLLQKNIHAKKKCFKGRHYKISYLFNLIFM